MFILNGIVYRGWYACQASVVFRDVSVNLINFTTVKTGDQKLYDIKLDSSFLWWCTFQVRLLFLLNDNAQV